MADPNQLEILKQGVEVWNKWRTRNRSVKINLRNADLRQANLHEANLIGANLSRSKLSDADLGGANMSKANLTEANLMRANLNATFFYEAIIKDAFFCEAGLNGAAFIGSTLSGTNFSRCYLMDADFSKCDLQSCSFHGAKLIGGKFNEANLTGAFFTHSNLTNVDFSGALLERASLYASYCHRTNFRSADLTKCDLRNASLIDTVVDQTTLANCSIHGISVWELKGTPKNQSNLIITPEGSAEVTVDDLQVAQFIYLLLNNQNVRNVVDTITSKAVLILGRFTKKRKAILDALQAELRKRNYLPILFDFSGPLSRDITETVSTLAHLARFIIADITDAKSIPQELQAIVPNLPSVPVQPILLASQKEYGMFGHFKRYPWVLPTYYYPNIQEVISSLPERILAPLEAKVVELTAVK